MDNQWIVVGNIITTHFLESNRSILDRLLPHIFPTLLPFIPASLPPTPTQQEQSAARGEGQRAAAAEPPPVKFTLVLVQRLPACPDPASRSAPRRPSAPARTPSREQAARQPKPSRRSPAVGTDQQQAAPTQLHQSAAASAPRPAPRHPRSPSPTAHSFSPAAHRLSSSRRGARARRTTLTSVHLRNLKNTKKRKSII
jgi:hypothetical protein